MMLVSSHNLGVGRFLLAKKALKTIENMRAMWIVKTITNLRARFRLKTNHGMRSTGGE